jgi:hypothetical protein
MDHRLPSHFSGLLYCLRGELRRSCVDQHISTRRHECGHSLTLMYEAVRGALASDDAQEQGGEDPRFRVRETPEWKKHAADLEAEMLKRGMLFSVIE